MKEKNLPTMKRDPPKHLYTRKQATKVCESKIVFVFLEVI